MQASFAPLMFSLQLAMLSLVQSCAEALDRQRRVASRCNALIIGADLHFHGGEGSGGWHRREPREICFPPNAESEVRNRNHDESKTSSPSHFFDESNIHTASAFAINQLFQRTHSQHGRRSLRPPHRLSLSNHTRRAEVRGHVSQLPIRRRSIGNRRTYAVSYGGGG